MSSAEKTNCFSHKSDQEPTSNEFVFTHEILECAFSDWLLLAESSYFPTNSRRAARCDNSALAMYPMNNVFVVWMCTNQCSHDTVVVCASSYASICDVCGSHSTVASPSICAACTVEFQQEATSNLNRIPHMTSWSIISRTHLVLKNGLRTYRQGIHTKHQRWAMRTAVSIIPGSTFVLSLA